MNFDALSSQLSFYIVVTRKFGRSAFERLLIFKFEMLAVLKFDCSKFQPSPGSDRLVLFYSVRVLLYQIIVLAFYPPYWNRHF